MVILAVDDERILADMIQDVLERQGHTCLTAGSVDEAEWLVEQVSFEGLVLDVGMPGKAPLDWLEELALARPALARRTLVVTGLPLAEPDVVAIHRCGAGILSKPFDIADLAAAVGRLGASSGYQRIASTTTE